MSVKSSVSMSKQQDAFVRSLVENGRYSSASAVIQQGLELLRVKTEREDAELSAMRAFIEARLGEATEDTETARAATQAMIAKKRAALGL